MVGKIKHVRQKIHQEAVKLDRPSDLAHTPGSVVPSAQSSEKPPPALGLPITTSPLLENNTSDASRNVKKVCYITTISKNNVDR